MAMKDFKGSKNYLKKAPPSSVHMYSKQKVMRKLQKDKLWALIIKAVPTLAFMVAGFFIGHLPGVLIGAIVGYQGGKYLLILLKKRVKYFKKIFKKPLR